MLKPFSSVLCAILSSQMTKLRLERDTPGLEDLMALFFPSFLLRFRSHKLYIFGFGVIKPANSFGFTL